MSSLLYDNYLLPYLHIFIYSFLFLHFALEFSRCPYTILQINYVDHVDVDIRDTSLSVKTHSLFSPLF